MDNQTQYPSDPNATQARSKPKPKRKTAALPDQPQPTIEEAPLVQPSQTSVTRTVDGTQTSPRPIQPKSNPQSNVTKPQPQPIRFAETAEAALAKVESAPTVRLSRFIKTRRWFRSRSGRIVLPLVTLLLGLAIGLGSILWYGWSGRGAIVIIPNSGQGNLIVEANRDLLTQLVSKQMNNAGLPGKVENVKVTLVHGDALNVQGDDMDSLFGLNFSRHLTIDVQPYVQTCVLQVHVTRADLGGIPVTNFAQSFESKIDQELAIKPTGLPSGLSYCAVGVHTEPEGMFVTYEAMVS